jgi:hypothetical protein
MGEFGCWITGYLIERYLCQRIAEQHRRNVSDVRAIDGKPEIPRTHLSLALARPRGHTRHRSRCAPRPAADSSSVLSRAPIAPDDIALRHASVRGVCRREQ